MCTGFIWTLLSGNDSTSQKTYPRCQDDQTNQCRGRIGGSGFRQLSALLGRPRLVHAAALAVVTALAVVPAFVVISSLIAVVIISASIVTAVSIVVVITAIAVIISAAVPVVIPVSVVSAVIPVIAIVAAVVIILGSSRQLFTGDTVFITVQTEGIFFRASMPLKELLGLFPGREVRAVLVAMLPGGVSICGHRQNEGQCKEDREKLTHGKTPLWFDLNNFNLLQFVLVVNGLFQLYYTILDQFILTKIIFVKDGFRKWRRGGMVVNTPQANPPGILVPYLMYLPRVRGNDFHSRQRE